LRLDIIFLHSTHVWFSTVGRNSIEDRDLHIGFVLSFEVK